MKHINWILFASWILPSSLYAIEGSELSQECITSMRNLYKFYYHQIQPHPNNESCKSPSEKLDQSETTNMEMIIAEFKNSCPAELIQSVNQSLVADTARAQS